MLAWLAEYKHVDARGVEIEGKKCGGPLLGACRCSRAISTKDSPIIPISCFDFVILSQTLQEIVAPLHVLEEMLRVGRNAIVAFPNFGHWTMRLSHLIWTLAPHPPVPARLVRLAQPAFPDGGGFCAPLPQQEWQIEREIYLQGDREVRFFPNLMAEVAVFSIRAR